MNNSDAEQLGELLKRLEEEMKHIKVLEPEDFPVTVQSVELAGATNRAGERGVGPKVGTFVSVRVAGQEKTLLGIYLGDMVVYSGQTSCAIDTRTNELRVAGYMMNPAIYVPDLNRVVWGMESWWGEIKSPEELREITDEDIQNIWYVKAMKQFAKKEDS